MYMGFGPEMLLISYISSQDWHPDYISSYNSLTDRHLRRFFSQPARRRQLGRTNMITPNGDVIAEREWRRQGRMMDWLLYRNSQNSGQAFLGRGFCIRVRNSNAER